MYQVTKKNNLFVNLFLDWIKPICLPLISTSVPRKNHVGGPDLFVAGWGKTEVGELSNYNFINVSYKIYFLLIG